MQSIRFTPGELKRNTPRPYTLSNACYLLRVQGCLLLENVFPAEYIDRLGSVFLRRYRRYLEDKNYRDALRVGDKRTMITVKVKRPFNSPYLYAHPLVYPILENLLGEDCILNGFGAVVSLPGAKDQHNHRDHPMLFDEALNVLLPPYALTVITPLVDLDGVRGTTRMWSGSHLVPLEQARTMEAHDPVAPRGSCLLMDYRLYHCGTSNRSTEIRPLLYNVYSRPWFRDTQNYEQQFALRMSRVEYRRVPEECRHLFAFARREWW